MLSYTLISFVSEVNREVEVGSGLFICNTMTCHIEDKDIFSSGLLSYGIENLNDFIFGYIGIRESVGMYMFKERFGFIV